MMDFDSLQYPPSLQPRNKVLVDEVLTSKQACTVCGLQWTSGEIRVHQKSKACHLHCFEPDYQVRINKTTDVKTLLNDLTNVRSFDHWVDRYNARFQTMSRTEIDTFCVHRIDGRRFRHRHLLEIFKFCSVKECSLFLPLVSSVWRDHSHDPEVWQTLLIRTYPSHPAPVSDPRRSFISMYYLSCYGCKCPFQAGDSVPIKHPLTKQPLCEDCFPKQFFNPVTQESYCKYLGLSAKYLVLSGVKPFFISRRAFVMPYEVKERVTEYRKMRLRKMCSRLMDAGTSEAQAAYDFLSLLRPEDIYHRDEVLNAVVSCPNDQVKRYVRHVFHEDSEPDRYLLRVAPDRKRRRTDTVYPAPVKQRKITRNRP